MRVINERALAGWSETRLERVGRGNRWREAAVVSAEPGHPVEVAVELDAVPMHCRWLWRAIDHHDRDGLASPKHDWRPAAHHGIDLRLDSALVKGERVKGPILRPASGTRQQSQTTAPRVAPGLPVVVTRSARRYLDAQHQSAHPLESVVAGVLRVGARRRCGQRHA